MSEGKRARSRSGAAWLAPLRPDDVARARMRGAILDRAAPLLARRRAGSVWELAEEAARRLAPLAGAAVLLFGWMAHRAGQEPPTVGLGVAVERPVGETSVAGPAVAVEDPVRSTGRQVAGPPAVLTSASAPSQDLVLAATLRGED